VMCPAIISNVVFFGYARILICNKINVSSLEILKCVLFRREEVSSKLQKSIWFLIRSVPNLHSHDE
jgi:hypothetical protein